MDEIDDSFFHQDPADFENEKLSSSKGQFSQISEVR